MKTRKGKTATRRKSAKLGVISVELPQDLYDVVRAEADEREQSMAALVRMLLRQEFASKDNPGKSSEI